MTVSFPVGSFGWWSRVITRTIFWWAN